MRYGFNNATTWSDPVASDSLAWLTLLGAAGAVGRDENLSVRFLWTRLGPSSRRVVETFCQVVILLFAVYFIYSGRSEEHTSELQSLMRISYAVFCLKQKKQ